jgi:hypothetical protein
LDKFGALGQAEAEVGEQEGDIGSGLATVRRRKVSTRSARLTGTVTSMERMVEKAATTLRALEPRLLNCIHISNDRYRARLKKQMSRWASTRSVFLMIDRAQAEIAFDRAESCFGLGELDIPAPKFGRVGFRAVGA